MTTKVKRQINNGPKIRRENGMFKVPYPLLQPGIIDKELRVLCVSQVHGCYYIIRMSQLGISHYQVS
ncbi:hypothetical protein J2T13_005351 [Paenibacillus sp. DS2015]